MVELLKAKQKGAKVRAGAYYFSSTKGGSHRVEIAAPSLGAIGKVLSDLRDVIAGGSFLRTTNEKHCTFCDFAPLCGPLDSAQAAQKRADAAADAIVRLGAHV